MSSIQLLFLIYLSYLSSCVLVFALPITSIPLKSNPEHLTWDGAYEPKTSSQYVIAKKITAKSIFITPNFNNLSAVFCAQGYKLDASGQCIQIVTINQADLLVSRLQSILSQTTKSNGDDYYDYEASEESTGPLQFDLFGLGVPQSLKGDSVTSHHKVVLPLPTTTTTHKAPDVPSTTTPKITTTTMTTTDLFSSSSQRFEIKSEAPSSIATSTTTSQSTNTTTAGTTKSSATTPYLNEQTSQNTLINENDQTQFFLANQLTANRTKMDSDDLETVATTMEFFTTMSDAQQAQTSTTKQQMPTTYPTSTSPSEYYESTDMLDESTPAKEQENYAEDLALLNSSLNEALKADFLIFDEAEKQETSTTMFSTTDTDQETPTTLFSDEESTEFRFETNEPSSSSSATLVSDSSVSPSTEILASLGTSTTQFRPSSTARSTTTVSEVSSSSALPKHDETNKALLKIENETKQSEQLRVSVMKNEMKANNLDRLEANNRFVYHHLSAGTEPLSTTEQTIEIDNNTYERRQLQPKGDPTELKRNRIRFPEPPSTPQIQSRSDMIRFPGPVASRASITTPATVNHLATDILDGRKIAPSDPSKPVWWLPTGWEVDRTTGSQKPLLLRFWSRMPLIRDPSLSFRNNDRDRNLRHRENSKSPRDNFYKEIASQDIYKVFDSNKQSRHYNHR